MNGNKKPISESLDDIQTAVGAGARDTPLHTHLANLTSTMTAILAKLEEMRVLLAGL